MNQIILASHGGLAEGARDTLSMVLGDVSNVHVVTLARDDKEPVSKEVERLMESFDENDAVYVCTDMQMCIRDRRWTARTDDSRPTSRSTSTRFWARNRGRGAGRGIPALPASRAPACPIGPLSTAGP